MKKHLILLMTLLGLACPAYAQTTALPKILADGFDAYKTSGSAKAVSTWLTGSPVGTATNISSLTSYYAGIDTSDGKYLGYESIGVVTISPSIKEYYNVILYQNGFLYNWFEVYTGGGTSVITTYSNNVTATAILPASFFIKDKTPQ